MANMNAEGETPMQEKTEGPESKAFEKKELAKPKMVSKAKSMHHLIPNQKMPNEHMIK